MKITFVISSLAAGGAERVTVTLSNYWAEKGFDVSIVTLAGQKQDFYTLHQGIKRIALNLEGDSDSFLSAGFANIRRILALRKLLKSLQPDVAIAMMTKANILLAIAASRLPLITLGSERVHPPMFPLRKLWEQLRSCTYGSLTAIVAQTHQSRQWLKSNTASGHIEVIPNPVSLPLSRNQPVVLPTTILNKHIHILLAAGRLEQQKGFDILIDVFSGLSFDFPDWVLVIAGEGPERQSLQEKIEQLNLEAQVILLGRVGNLSDWYKASDLYVMSSRFEGFPNSLVEAMAHGLPVISFDCDTGPREIIRDGVDGVLVDNGDVKGMRVMLETLMSDHELRQRLADRATDVKERFSLPKIAGMWEQLIYEVKDE